MVTFRKILFPVDFSERCVQTAPYVASIARKSGSDIALLHVFDLHGGYGIGSSTVYAAYADLIRERRSDELESFGCRDFDGLNITRAVELGETADVITRYADEHGADLIIMPTHGRGRFRALLLGSVTSKVLHDAACPVWTTAHSEALAVGDGKDIAGIVCAVDLSPDTVRVIQAARDVADRYESSVRLVHAIPAPEAGSSGELDETFRRFLFDTANSQLIKRQQEAGTHYDLCIKVGPVSAVVREAAVKSGANLVVIGRGRAQELLGRLRTSVSAIVRESPCPVLSV
jgi:nucleotide-binding universal stress UspA family protein